jgi:multiple sugar transport system substrate-binding protein
VAENLKARALFQDALSGRLDRRTLLQRAAAIGLSAPVAMALAQASIRPAFASEEGTLSVTYYDWILNLHSPITQVNEDFNATYPLKAEVAPTQGFGIERFVAEARDNTSTWDMYIGATPFLEMIQLVESGSIEPWDPYLPEGLLDDINPAIRAEGTYQDKFYVWPFLLDVIVQGWNSDIVTAAGLDPEAAPKNWDEYLANAKKVQESGAAPFGCTYDFHAWRSFLPITHSISTDVYDPETGLFLWDSDAAVAALEIMKQMYEYANPDVNTEGKTDAGVNQTPDEQAFAAQQVAYYIKYQNAHLRFAGTWPDPSKLVLAALPVQEGGAGGTVFWDTGATLFKNGKNKEQASQYMQALTKDQRIWEHSVVGKQPDETAVGQLPVYQSVWDEYAAAPPEWLASWATDIWNGLDKAKAIAPSKLSLTQFSIATPFYVAYLEGDESDAKTALTKAKDAVTRRPLPGACGATLSPQGRGYRFSPGQADDRITSIDIEWTKPSRTGSSHGKRRNVKAATRFVQRYVVGRVELALPFTNGLLLRRLASLADSPSRLDQFYRLSISRPQ